MNNTCLHSKGHATEKLTQITAALT